MLRLSRAEAGRRLAAGLGATVKEIPIVIAVSPGGVRVASEVARAFDAPLDLWIALRLEVPGRVHSIFGAVADGESIVLPERVKQLGLPQDYVDGIVAITHGDVEKLARSWRNGLPALELADKAVILVDDGLSESVLVAAVARALRARGARRLIYAAPAAAPELWAALASYCDDRLLLFPADAPAGAMICDPQFEQTTRLEVAAMLRRSRPAALVTATG